MKIRPGNTFPIIYPLSDKEKTEFVIHMPLYPEYMNMKIELNNTYMKIYSEHDVSDWLCNRYNAIANWQRCYETQTVSIYFQTLEQKTEFLMIWM